MSADSTIDVVLVYPELLGTYGDRGNANALVHRAEARGLDIRVLEIGIGDPLPRQSEVYLIGGGEDAAMLLAWDHLHEDRAIIDAAESGSAVFGVCAGLQLLGHEFFAPDGSTREGLGLLDVRCGRLQGERAVGEVLADAADDLGLGFLTGFENHQGDAQLGPDARPLGHMVRGIGNGDSATEGAVQGSVIGTYLHGPALVRNPALADHLLQIVAGPLTPWVDEPFDRLRQERRAAALAGREPRRGKPTA